MAAARLGQLGARWEHVQAVGALTEALVAAGLVPDVVASAAWLHDVGYGPGIAATGFHAEYHNIS